MRASALKTSGGQSLLFPTPHKDRWFLVCPYSLVVMGRPGVKIRKYFRLRQGGQARKVLDAAGRHHLQAGELLKRGGLGRVHANQVVGSLVSFVQVCTAFKGGQNRGSYDVFGNAGRAQSQWRE